MAIFCELFWVVEGNFGVVTCGWSQLVEVSMAGLNGIVSFVCGIKWQEWRRLTAVVCKEYNYRK